MERKRNIIITLLLLIGMLCIPTSVSAEGAMAGLGLPNDNILITIRTNKDVDQLVMNSGKGEFLVTPHTEYSDEEQNGNNMTMDMNGDLLVDQKDFDILKKHVDGECKDFTVKERCPHCGAADINDDKKIDQTDLDLLQSHLDGTDQCEQDDCYFHGTRIYREESKTDPNEYIWTIPYTPTNRGIDTISFKPQSFTTNGVRTGEPQTITVHAEEYKNPEILKCWVEPNQDKYLVHYKSGQPVTIYAVTPLENDKVKINIKNQLNPSDVTEVELAEWDSIDYEKAEKTWKYEYITDNRGWRDITVTGYGEQSKDSDNWIEGKVVESQERIVDPQVLSCNTSTVPGWLEVWYTYWSSTDAEGNTTSGSTRHERQWYNHTTTAVCNDDTDYVYFSTSGPSGYSYSYSTSGNTRTYQTSWTDLSGGGSGSADPYAVIGAKPEATYKYTVIFNSQEGTEVPPTEAEYDTTISQPISPTKVGYTFEGWFKDGRGINAWNFGSDTIRGTTILYAKWKPITCTVAFDSQGGNAVSSKTVSYGGTIASPAVPSRSNYTFSGWYKNSACTEVWNFSTGTVTSNMTLYAKWTPVAFKITFESNGGSYIYPKAVNYDALITEPTPPPTMTGYTFSGWFKDSECTKPWNFSSDVVKGATTLFAKWTLGEYTVKFDSQGGSSVSDIAVHHNTRIAAPTGVTRSGYTLAGWYKEATAINRWRFDVFPILESTTLYAKWTADKATIEFDSKGGSAVAKMTGVTDKEIASTEIPIPTRSGYVFEGWFEAEDYSGDAITALPDKYPVGATKYYAKWHADEAVIEYNTNGGDPIPSLTGKTDDVISNTAIPTPVRIGYEFAGWFKTSELSGGVVTKLPDKFGSGTTTYYAKWNSQKAYIKFNTNGGSYIVKLFGTTDAEINPTTMPVTTRDGYTFKGWFGTDDFSGSEVTVLPDTYPAGTTEYFAKWDALPSVIHFDTMGGDPIADMNGFTDDVIADTTMPTPSRLGYSFLGWYTEADYSSAKATDLPGKYPVSGITYYAKWAPDEATIEFNTNGAAESFAKMIGVTDRDITDTAMPVVTKAGYTFAGWFAAADFTGAEVTVLPGKYPAGNTVYYAKWTANPATIKFEVNGGDQVADMVGVTDKAITNPAMPTMSRTGYTFGGWFSAADFSGAAVTALPAKYPIGTTTYYAKWTAIQYTVTFDSQAGSAVSAQQVAYDTSAMAPGSPTLDGFTFTGWFTDAGCTTKWDFAADKIKGNTTLFAGWTVGIPGPEVPLEYWSWAQIKYVADRGLGETYFEVAEEKNITLSTGEILTLQIYGFNHDQLADGTSNKTNITFGLKNLMKDKRQMNATATNVGGWDASNLRTWTNGTLFNSLASDLQGAISSVNKNTASYPAGLPLITSADRLFIFSDEEVFESNVQSSFAGEGLKYAIFTNNAIRTKKITDIASNWWLRSVAGNQYVFHTVSYIGTENSALSSNNEFGVNFGFAVGNAPTNTYTVTYDSKGGSAVASAPATLNTSISAPTDPTKSEYTFGGWYKDSACTSKFTFGSDKISGNTTLYAKWQATVTFDSMGGSAVGSIESNIGSRITSPPTPSKTGHVFKGWYNDVACLNEFNFVVDTVMKNKTLYAKWSLGVPDASVPLNDWSWEQIKIVADAGLGQSYFDVGEYKDITLSTGEVLRLQIYGFNHDQLADGSSNKSNITFGSKTLSATPQFFTPVTNSISSQGGWELSKIRAFCNDVLYYQFDSKLQDAIKVTSKTSLVNQIVMSVTNTSDNVFIFSDTEVFGSITKTYASGYTAASGLFGDKYPIFNDTSNYVKHLSTGSVETNWCLRTNATLGNNFNNSYLAVYNGVLGQSYPHVKNYYSFGFCIGNAPTNTYQTTFNTNGGSAISPTISTLNTTITKPTDPTKANAIFNGWYKDVGLTQSWNFASDKVTGPMTLYAKWNALPPMGNALETYTWAQIKQISEAGLADNYWNVGDEKLVNISGTNYAFQIYDFKHDDKADGSGKAGITFGMKGIMNVYHAMNPIYSNNEGWDGCDMRAYLNGVTTAHQDTNYASSSVYIQLPSDLQTAITSVKKYSSGGNNNHTLVTSIDKLFLFSDEEVSANLSTSVSGEGYHYPIFTDSSSRIKKTTYNQADIWWLRSVENDTDKSFLGFNEIGNPLNPNPPTELHGVSFGFCV